MIKMNDFISWKNQTISCFVNAPLKNTWSCGNVKYCTFVSKWEEAASRADFDDAESEGEMIIWGEGETDEDVDSSVM